MDTKNLTLEINGDQVSFEYHQVPETDNLAEYSFRCVDGRYTIEDCRKAILAFPGAHAGVLATLLATLRSASGDTTYDAKTVAEAFLKMAGGTQNFTFHTDNHNHGGSPAQGCGHVKLMRNNPDVYLLAAEDIEVLNNLLNLAKNEAPDVEVELNGSHGEKAVILIRGRYNVPCRGNNGEIQAFTFNEYSFDVLKHVAQHIIERGIVVFNDGEISAEDFAGMLAETAALQLSLTVSKLAPNLPITRIDFTQGEIPVLTELGTLGEEGRVSAENLFK